MLQQKNGYGFSRFSGSSIELLIKTHSSHVVASPFTANGIKAAIKNAVNRMTIFAIFFQLSTELWRSQIGVDFIYAFFSMHYLLRLRNRSAINRMRAYSIRNKLKEYIFSLLLVRLLWFLKHSHCLWFNMNLFNRFARTVCTTGEECVNNQIPFTKSAFIIDCLNFESIFGIFFSTF